MKGDFDETCENVSCDRVATVVVVISHSDGSASIKNYCSEHEGEGLATLKRNNVGIKLVDHRGRASGDARQQPDDPATPEQLKALKEAPARD